MDKARGRTGTKTSTKTRTKVRRGKTAVAPHTVKAIAPPARARRGSRTLGAQLCIGEVVRWDAEGPWVDFAGNDAGPLRARVAMTAADPRETATPLATVSLARVATAGVGSDAGSGPGGAVRSAHDGQPVVLVVDPRPGHAPALLGFLTPVSRGPAASLLEARVDGRRVEIDGSDEIILRCGDASITLRRNGRIAIRGVDVETRASGSNRIKGGTVNIN